MIHNDNNKRNIIYYNNNNFKFIYNNIIYNIIS
jgi:hypothetical protein